MKPPASNALFSFDVKNTIILTQRRQEIEKRGGFFPQNISPSKINSSNKIMKNDYSGTLCILNIKLSNILACFSSKKIMCKLLYHPLRLHMWSAHFVINTSWASGRDRKEEGM